MQNIFIQYSFTVGDYLDQFDSIFFLNNIICSNTYFKNIYYKYNNKYIIWKNIDIKYNHYIYTVIDDLVFPSQYEYYLKNNIYELATKNKMSKFIFTFDNDIINNYHFITLDKISDVKELYLGNNDYPYYRYYNSYLIKTHNIKYLYDIINKYNRTMIFYYYDNDNKKLFYIKDIKNNIKKNINKEEIKNYLCYGFSNKVYQSFYNIIS
jgi:hypothetical protein